MMSFAVARLGKRETWLGVFTYSLFIFSTFTLTGVEISVILLYLVVIYHRTRSAPDMYLPFWVVAPFLIWLGVAVLSALVNPDSLSNLEELRHQYRIFLPLALLASLKHVDVTRLLKVYLVFVCLMAVYGIMQSFWGVDWFRLQRNLAYLPFYFTPENTAIYRARGNFNGPNAYGDLMMVAGIMFLSLMFCQRSYSRYFWGAGAFMAVTGLVLSLGRSAWIGFFVGLLVMALRLPRRWAISLIATGVGVLLLAIALLASGWVERNFAGLYGSRIAQRLISTTPSEASGRIRLLLWRAGIMAIKENPWLGVGLENQEKIVPYHKRIFAGEKNLPYADPTSVVHNSYLQAGFYLGLFGLGAFLSMWVGILTWNGIWIVRAGNAFPFEKGLLWGSSGGLAGFMVEGIFQDTFFSGTGNAIILIFMGLSLYGGNRIRESTLTITTS